MATGRTASVYVNEDRVPSRLRFLFDIADVTMADDAAFEAADLVAVVDTSQPSRTDVPKSSPIDWCNRRQVLNIDHHFTNAQFGQVNWVVGDASSTCELVFEILQSLDFQIDRPTGSLLYSGILTDTGGFSLPNTTSKSLHIAANLTELGVSPVEMAETINRSLGQPQFELLKLIYKNTRIIDDGAIAYSTISHQALREIGCKPSDIDDQVNVPRTLAGIAMAALFTEVKPGRVRINLRGESNTEVASLAQQFGGGGHRQAAGVIFAGTLEEAVNQIIPAAVATLDNQSCESANA